MILFSGLNIQAAESNLEQKADTLNKLGVLKGDGKSYNLTGTLTRQEAATFIVRLLGAEKEILEHKNKYATIAFTDVKSQDWAAPYIGYCVQKGIINGYTDNSFRPRAKLELQAFAKLLLVALGYQYDKDFTWDDTLTKAQGVKLVTGQEISLAKGNPFTRGDVIKLLDRILTMKNTRTGKEMFYNLVKNDGVSENTLAQVGFIRKQGQQRVEEVKELSRGRYSIRFSTPPKSFSAENMVVVEETGRNLKVKSMQVTDLLNVYVVDIDQPAENVKYQVWIKDIIDRNNAYFVEYKKEFVALRQGGLESDFFRISQVSVLDKKTLEVEFTHPIGEIMTNNSLYTIKNDNQTILARANDLSVSLAGDSKVRIKILSASLVHDGLYSLLVDGSAQSRLGVRINSGREDLLRFMGKQTEEAKFDLIAIDLVDRNKLRLTTNKQVSPKTAEQVFSYLLTDSSKSQIAINKASVLENHDSLEQNIILDLNQSLVEGRNYVLLINQLYTEGRTEEIIEKEYPFTAGSVNSTSYDLSSAGQIDPYTIEFNFDTTMDQRTATVASNYYIRKENGGKTLVPTAVYHDYERGRMLLYLGQALRETNGADYILYAKPEIKGANGESRKANAKITFGVHDLEVQKVGFERVVYSGDNSIQILFNEPVAKAVPNLDVTNYRIYDQETKEDLFISGVHYIDGHRLVLITQNYNPAKRYELKVNQILEYNNTSLVDHLGPVEIEAGNLVR